MIIQQNAITKFNPPNGNGSPDKNRRWASENEREMNNQILRNGKNNGSKKIRKRANKKQNKIDPVVLVPTRIEDAPLRRMDRRALNALRRRRSDKHMICCLAFSAIIFIAAGFGALGVELFADLPVDLGPLVIIGPILVVCGILLIVFSCEMCIRLRKQVKRVMDPSLLKTSNLHEVKHWIEPELISFGWGQFDYQEEAKLLDENHLRKITKTNFVV